MIYHITNRSQWEAAQRSGTYRAPSLRDEGFIHCSTVEQIPLVANSVFRGECDLLILCIDEAKLAARTAWEAPLHPASTSMPDATERMLFPHVYGLIDLLAVRETVAISEDVCGLKLPPNVPT